MKLLPATSFNQVAQIGMAIRGIVAQDPNSGTELHTSYGKQKAGRGHHYWIKIPTCNFAITERGNVYYDELGFRLTAYSDTEAIDKANAILATPS